MMRSLVVFLFFALLFITPATGADPELPSPQDNIRQLNDENEQVRDEAERRLREVGIEAVDELAEVYFRQPPPSPHACDAILRVLSHWERNSWTDPNAAKSLNRFVVLARNIQDETGESFALRPRAVFRIAETLRVLDVSPDEAAAYLRSKRGIKIHKLPGGFYSTVEITRDWQPNPKDFLYIANLAREIEKTPYVNGRRHPISIDVAGRVESELLVDCFKNFRKSLNDPFDLFIGSASVSRELLLVLRHYSGLTGLGANAWDDDITDEDWAKSISEWPKIIGLTLSPTAGRKSIAAADRLQHLMILKFRNRDIDGDDLRPLRDNENLQVLWVWNGMSYTEYINQKGTGKWQLEERRKDDSPADALPD